jgi:hypothetical protein
MLTYATVFNYSADMKAIIADLLDSYKYVQSQTGLRADLIKAGAMIDVDPRRCAALGWSAGGSSVIYLVSQAGIISITVEGMNDILESELMTSQYL